jgi:hypothetical protein
MILYDLNIHFLNYHQDFWHLFCPFDLKKGLFSHIFYACDLGMEIMVVV